MDFTTSFTASIANSSHSTCFLYLPQNSTNFITHSKKTINKNSCELKSSPIYQYYLLPFRSKLTYDIRKACTFILAPCRFLVSTLLFSILCKHFCYFSFVSACIIMKLH